MRDPVNDSVSSSGYFEIPSSLGQETERLGPSKLSGTIHRNAKLERPLRRVTFDGQIRSMPGNCVSTSHHAKPIEHVPPEIELPVATTLKQNDTKYVTSEVAEDTEPLERFQILIRLGFHAHFHGQDSAFVPRHFWIYEDTDEGYILLWADCECTSLKGAIPLRDMVSISCTEGAGLAISAGEEVVYVFFTSPRERDFWKGKLALLKSLS